MHRMSVGIYLGLAYCLRTHKKIVTKYEVGLQINLKILHINLFRK